MTALLGALGLVGSLLLIGFWLSERITARRASLRLADSADASSSDSGAGGIAAGRDGEATAPDRSEEEGRVAAALRRTDAASVLFVVCGFAAGLGFARLVLGLSAGIAAATGLDFAILVGLALATRGERRSLQLEAQLASWLRLVAAGLRAGLGRVDALTQALAQVGDPLARVLAEPIGRLRLGEDPGRAFARLRQQVPLESFRLFALVLTAQWHAGGSLQNTLGSIGEALQDRVDVARRIQTQSAPTRSSVLTLIGATIAIAVFSYSNDPANLERFLRSAWGDGLVATALGLQGLSLVWIWQLTRTRV